MPAKTPVKHLDEAAAEAMEALLSEKQAAQILGLQMYMMARMRKRGDGPPFLVLSCKIYRYRPAALREWMKEREVKSLAALAASRPDRGVELERMKGQAKLARAGIRVEPKVTA
jgi:hypothetical protein